MQPPAEPITSIARNSAIMAAGTISSRITGVLRDFSIAAAIGSAVLADTYALGNALPFAVYMMVAGGALNAVFIPQLVRAMRDDPAQWKDYADRLLTFTAMVVVLLAAAAVLFAPWLISLYATADYSATDYDLATAFARFCLPQIAFYGIFTMLSQVLNARGVFGPPMFAPIVNNIVVIGAAGMFVWLAGTAATANSITAGQTALLGVGTTIGVAAQAIVLIPFLRRAGYSWRPKFGLRGHGLGKAARLAGWTVGFVTVNQAGFLLISRLATEANVTAVADGVVPQGLATYQRALLVFLVPHAVITISIVTAMFPRMSTSAAAGERERLANQLVFGTRSIAVVILPCSGFLLLFGPNIGSALFGAGANAGDPASYTGIVASAFAVGMLPFSLYYLLLRAWYAMEDTRTPFYIAVGYNIAAAPIIILLFWASPSAYKVAAIALGYSLTYVGVAFFVWWLTKRRLGGLGSGTTSTLTRMAGSALLAAAVAWGCTQALSRLLPFLSAGEGNSQVLTGLILVTVGAGITAAVYLFIARLLHVAEVSALQKAAGASIRRVRGMRR